MARLHLSDTARKFLREVGTIILGVLIALGIGEVADAIRWRLRVDTTMVTIRQELGGDRFNLEERLAYQDCLVTRLSAIGRVLQDARLTGRLPTVRNLSSPAIRLTQQYAYEIARSEGAPLHMPSSRARELAQLYGGLAAYAAATEEEFGYWKTLALMKNVHGRIDDDLLATLLQAWTEASQQAHIVDLIARQLDSILAEMGIAILYDAETPNREAMVRQARGDGTCSPLMVDGRPFAPSAAGN